MDHSVQSIERAHALLDVLARRPDISLGHLAEAAGLHPPTARRMLLTLESIGYVFQNPDSRKYRLGPILMYLGRKASEQSPLREFARPQIEHLVDISQETVYTATLHGNDVLYVDVVESRQSIRMSTSVGDRCPAYSTATGRVLLSYLNEEQLAQYLRQEFPRQTSKTVTDSGQLAKVIMNARTAGFSITVDEQEDGVTSIAAPILVGDTSVAAIAVAGPTFRLPHPRVTDLVGAVVNAAHIISANFRPGSRAEVTTAT